ncbi:hypothetical protein GWK16_05230 [Roseomonas sp. JC162]|uniref:Uncharacterized protein n=1 Tax=Neoroseomonas marina TaxID=1232220 RepID=A0A848E869_9PROT|nr:hypothetical protein [Neoroseomonas marina]NMJ40631.1 hypothetical protein [Neoroseomonas marina]
MAAGEPEPIPVLHPNLPALYRRRVEALEQALAGPVAAMAATEALRAFTDRVEVRASAEPRALPPWS